ncbi:MAG: uroporphyrinogen-III synthase [Bernardetiaceae bacterium]
MANATSNQANLPARELLPVKSILISQPEPPNTNSPYHRLAAKYNLQIDFRPFIEVQAVPHYEFRKQRIHIPSHEAVIFTSRNAVDHFFQLCKDLRVEVSPEMKYFCISEQTANYLHKYITVRKRKVYTGERTAQDLLKVIAKQKKLKYLFPCSDIRRNDIPDFLAKEKIEFTEAVIYRTVPSDLSDLEHVNYDMIAFFSPSGIHSLFHNFPGFKQNQTRIAAFGPTTAKAVRDHHLILDVEAPQPNAPSMTGAIELYVQTSNKA